MNLKPFSIFILLILVGPRAIMSMTPSAKLRTMLSEAKDAQDPISILTILKVMNELGEEVPAYDLCQLKVPEANLFCKKNLGINRIRMPQLKGIPRARSAAAKLKRDVRGEVDATEQFKKYLSNKGYALTPKRIPAIALKATQNELIGSRIASMWWALKKNPHDPGIRAPIFVSSDNYILDGHHRWAAIVGTDFSDGKIGNVTMDTIQVNLPIRELVGLAHDFAKEFGIQPAAGVSGKEGFYVSK